LRFHLVDSIIEVAEGKRIRAAKLASCLDPVIEQHPSAGPALAPTLVIECLAQTSAWLIMATTDFAQRGVLAGLRDITFGRPAPVGERLDLLSEVDSWSDEAVVFNVEACCRGETAVRIEGALCFLIPCERLEDPALTRQHYDLLLRDDAAEGAAVPARAASPASPPAQLPASQWAPYDVLQELVPGKEAKALKSVVMSDPVFATHFPRFAVMPAVLLMESLLHLGGSLLAKSGPSATSWRVKRVQAARFRQYVRPGDELILQARVQDLSETEASVVAAAEVSGRSAAALRRVHFAPQA